MLNKAIVVKEENITALKSALVRQLNKKGMTQEKISSALGISQPMVSKYLSQKNIYSNLSDLAERICKMGSIHCSYVFTPAEIVEGKDYFISPRDSMITEEKSDVLNSIHKAIKLMEGHDLSAISPKVKMNIASATNGAVGKNDIASIPSGLVIADNRLRTYLQAEFGASHHLSGILLYAMKINNNIRSVVNIKYNNQILKIAKEKKISCLFLNNDYGMIGKERKFDILIHKGSFGLEPASYVFGSTPEEAVKKCMMLA
ncbi:hypothetical protein J4401_02035 [Candidatus Woesearchaeota archaeon]|nr:hypothetical protein [Candidatus Woesearchaeota archaeon]